MFIVWIIVLLCSLISLLNYLFSVGSANGAPQQAAIAAMSMAACVIPYVLARSIEGITGGMRTRSRPEKQTEGTGSSS